MSTPHPLQTVLPNWGLPSADIVRRMLMVSRPCWIRIRNRAMIEIKDALSGNICRCTVT